MMIMLKFEYMLFSAFVNRFNTVYAVSGEGLNLFFPLLYRLNTIFQFRTLLTKPARFSRVIQTSHPWSPLHSRLPW